VITLREFSRKISLSQLRRDDSSTTFVTGTGIKNLLVLIKIICNSFTVDGIPAIFIPISPHPIIAILTMFTLKNKQQIAKDTTVEYLI